VIEAFDLFEPAADFPDPRAAVRYAQLVGLDEVKEILHKEATLLLDPQLLREWSKRHHRAEIAALGYFGDRPPLFLFGGDVGTGKTQLAETFGDRLAAETETSIRLRKLSLNSRGTGRVGEMTKLISSAFSEVAQEARRFVVRERRTGAVILIIDEADALAQSRELQQMHHEDRAGVNALIRSVSQIAEESLPVLVVACTNRINAIDPAIRRRAAHTFTFSRPNTEQREAVLAAGLAGLDFTPTQIRQLAEATGPRGKRAYGANYSDLTQRLIPAAILDAFPNRPLEFPGLLSMAKGIEPTAPFAESPT